MKWENVSDRTEWNQFVQSVKHATPFHTWEWGQVIAEGPTSTTYLGCREPGGLLVAGCPFLSVQKGAGFRVLDSRRYTDLWGPIFSGEAGESTTAIAALKPSLGGPLRHRIVMARLRTDDAAVAHSLAASSARSTKESGYFLLDLGKRPPDSLWDETFAHRHRRIVNYFERVGAHVKVSSDDGDFLSFQELNKKTMLAQGYKVLSASFFQGIRKYFGKDFMTLNVSVEGRLVGTIGFFLDRSRGTVFPSYSGYETDVPRSPFFFAYWSLINWSFQNGFNFLNFGNTSSDPTHRNYLLKKSLGGEFVQQYTLVIPTSEFLYSIARSLSNILGR
jgi:hypothetical protein